MSIKENLRIWKTYLINVIEAWGISITVSADDEFYVGFIHRCTFYRLINVGYKRYNIRAMTPWDSVLDYIDDYGEFPRFVNGRFILDPNWVGEDYHYWFPS